MNATYEFVIAPYNDIVKTGEIVNALPPNLLAAILVEPMQVAGGCNLGTQECLRYLRDLATIENAVLIFDETMTSRLGYGGIQVPLNIKPDIMTIGKWAGGAMSLGAYAARREIMEWFHSSNGKLAHSVTSFSNIVTKAAGIAGCTIMTGELQDKLNALGTKAMADIKTLIHERIVAPNGRTTEPKIFVVGYGSLFAIRFNRSKMLRCGICFTIVLSVMAFISLRGVSDTDSREH